MAKSESVIANPTRRAIPSSAATPFLLCFAFTLFLSAGLLFLVEPMIAKMILPLLGGVPSIWNTCMVFFQAALLAGYAYAHIAPAWLGIRRHAIVHLALLLTGFVVLPIRVSGWLPAAESNPFLWLLLMLLVSVGLPFFVIASSAPVLQRWFAGSGHGAARDPYFLYGASNLGSLAALVAYPLLIEPYLRLANQSWVWLAGYGLLVILTAACAWLVRNSREETAAPKDSDVPPAAPRFVQRCRWVALAFVPSSMMLGVTTYITTDVASVPLLWVLPLGIYLLTFIIVFSRVPPLLHQVMVFLLPLIVLLILAASGFQLRLEMDEALPLHLVALFVTAMVCHGELARTRPAARYLTEFYLWMALGGMLGGLFNALVAPLVFDRIVEYPLIIACACLLRPTTGLALRGNTGPRQATQSSQPAERSRKGKRQAKAVTSRTSLWEARWLRPSVTAGWMIFGLAAGAIFYYQSFSGDPTVQVYRSRNFFGVLRVVEADRLSPFRQLFHGTTLHGMQSVDPALRQEPLSYYHRTGPIGQVFEALNGPEQRTNVAVVGLGAGTLASYARKGDRWTFFEIDPDVEHIAHHTPYFTYLRDAEERGVDVRVVLGDGRIQLRESNEHYGVIVIDAFSSDSVPVHLLTREAFTVYVDKLDPNGLLAFNLSSNFFELAPVVADLARQADLVCYYQEDRVDRAEVDKGKYASRWAVLARRPEHLGKLSQNPRWARVEGRSGHAVWTDDYSNLFDVIRWHAPVNQVPSKKNERSSSH